MDIDGELARTVVAVAESGTLDAAAARLHITPSAVSQRLKALETQLGRPVLHRTRPVELTSAGDAVCGSPGSSICSPPTCGPSSLLTPDRRAGAGHHRRQRRLLAHLGVAHRSPHWPSGPPSRCCARTRRTRCRCCVAAPRAGAVTGDAEPCRGASVEPLGVMRYLAVCAPRLRPAVVRRWRDGGRARHRAGRWRSIARTGCSASACAGSPGRRGPANALRPGVGGVCRGDRARDGLGHAPARSSAASRSVPASWCGWATEGSVDVALYWQQWRRDPALLGEIGMRCRRPRGAQESAVSGTRVAARVSAR